MSVWNVICTNPFQFIPLITNYKWLCKENAANHALPSIGPVIVIQGWYGGTGNLVYFYDPTCVLSCEFNRIVCVVDDSIVYYASICPAPVHTKATTYISMLIFSWYIFNVKGGV